MLPRRPVHRNKIANPATLRLLTAVLAVALWLPAIGIRVGPVTLQPVDVTLLIGYPIIISYLPRVSAHVWLVVALSVLSSLIALFNGGEAMIAVYYILFATPFMLLLGIIFASPETRWQFIKSFVLGGTLSILLFIAQIVIGPTLLDFRTNTNFSLPNYGERGFAVFPEVSTFATHVIILMGAVLVAVRDGRIPRFFRFGRVGFVLALALIALLFSRSSSVILVAPIVAGLAYLKGRPMTPVGLLGTLVMTLAGMVLLQVYVSYFYVDRAEGSALRSIMLRGITMLAGLSVLPYGEVFGVGLGNNEIISLRVVEVARQLGFPLLLIPDGVNSFVIARIFEEGYLAVLLFGVAVALALRAVFLKDSDPTVKIATLLAVASMLASLMVIGYRGIYMNWFWLAVPAALLGARSRSRVTRRRAPPTLSPSELVAGRE